MTESLASAAPKAWSDQSVPGPMVDGPRRIRLADERGTDRRAQVAAARQYADELRARRRAGEAVPAGEWAARERAALDALAALIAFLDNHPTSPVAQAVVHAARQQHQAGAR